jgi:hypothetical protein
VVTNGLVDFYSGNTPLGSAMLDANGQATVDVTAVGVGTASLKAVLRSGSFPASTSAVVNVTVTSGTVTPAPTTTALASSLNPAVVGQAVTFTATVRGPAGSGTPTGTVVFTEGNVTLGRGEVQADGTATFTTSFATAGGHAITASYSGDANFAASSQAFTEQVNAPALQTTTADLSTSIATAVFGQNEVLTATVTSPAGVPTGTVTFLDGNTALGTAQVNAAGQALLPVSLGVGNHQLTAVYGGTAAFAGSTSAAAAVTVSPAATAVTLAPSLNPAVTGQSVTFTATVAAVAPGAGTPTGTVTFMDGSVLMGTFAVGLDGTATFITTFAAAGGHAITAVYNGDANFASSSQALTEQVNAPALQTTTDFSTSSAAAVFGQTEVLTATVTSPAGTPTGFVTFKDGNTVLGTAPLDANGQATLPVSLGVGSHTLTAAFMGSGFADSSSAAVGVTVNFASTTVALGSSVNSAAIGQAVTFTATVAAVAPGAGTPTGTVTFRDGAVILGTVAVGGGGRATFTTSFAVAGGHAITATYSGDVNFVGSAQALTETVTSANRAPSLAPIANQTVPSTQGTIQVPLAASDPDGDALTFSVTAQSLAFVLNRQAGGLTYHPEYDNIFRAGEKWLRSGSTGRWYFVKADGTLWQWNGSASASGTNLGKVGTSYYADPRLISSAPANQPHATFSISGSTLTVTRDPAWNSAMVITVTVSDGHGGTDTKTFTVNVV